MTKRNIIYLFTVGVLYVLTASCSGNGEPYFIKGTPESKYLRVSTNNISLGSNAGSQSFNITSNTDWQISCDASWLTISANRGSGNETISVSVKENTESKARQTTIIISYEGNKREIINVKQAGAEEKYLTIYHTSSTFEAGGGTLPLTITSNTSWTASTSESWITLSQYTGNGDAKINVTAQANPSTTQRQVTITFSYGDKQNSIIVEQESSGSIEIDTVKTVTVNGVSFKMIRVEGGTFTMGATSEQGGDAHDWEKPTHSVTLSSYSIGETEVTQALWEAVMGQRPTSDGSQWSSTNGLGNNYPAYYVSWNDCQDFIRRLNSLTGEKFCLPTEAEWEYAARGGNKSRGYKYAGSNTIGNVAWYRENSYDMGLYSPYYGSQEVGSKAANELGLYDMSGNVFEWCYDWYYFYSSDTQTNPIGPATQVSQDSIDFGRVIRGGSWTVVASSCRVSWRLYDSPDNRNQRYGLRLALSEKSEGQPSTDATPGEKDNQTPNAPARKIDNN